VPKLDRGGELYWLSLLVVRARPCLRGIKELSETDVLEDCNRETGGGRLSVIEKQPDINTVFLQRLKEHTAGAL
jgi:hypothetical protein